ncbi:unnamed protein product [Vitrella brassicaformis CCMP3155]|uniref:Uncharacterized protein n=1 Tax=Vitrella brassicaformis (strain CCMP3155) TaxID=1169540 RepID=A0A0G4F927_VITBC|nr:unnamed protein product [Vitrella brassicaformis CCMP3155]|mmetsp:Transcript_13442/g.32100  ORF Transcript_13442/g.32100 Transcript_13442/m.32100 type:complete len:305 (-) Transcript_13442:84-998(-)|eukprot:CEM08840.1 unnamed protein product [Vitrella brassicaformis CCMP3155]
MSSEFVPWKSTATLRGHKGSVQNVRFNKDGSYCLSCGQDKTLRLWNPHKGLFIKEYKGPHNHEVNDAVVTPDNAKFASVGGDKFGFMWDVATGNVIRRLTGHEGKINCCEFNSSHELLITGSWDRTVRCWDLKSNTRAPLQILKEAKDSVTALCVTDDEILTGSVDGRVRRYDVRMGRLTTDDLKHPIGSVTLSNDENCVLVTCLDDTIRLLEKGTGELLNSYRGHTNHKYRVRAVLDPSDAHIFCGSEDHRLCVWDLLNPKLLHHEKAHGGAIFTVRFHAEKEAMLTTSADGLIKVWRQEAPE